MKNQSIKNKTREATVTRKTKETDILIKLNLDGSGKSSVKLEIPFLKHMLEQVARHGFFDLDIKASGDLDIDNHHLNEDVALALGEAFKQALGDKRGIRRFGYFYVPMDDSLARVVVDLSGRPFFILGGLQTREMKRDDYYFADMEHFFRSFSQSLGANLQLDILRGEDKHHIMEASFKALAKAMDMATAPETRSAEIPSTKGTL